MFFSFSDGQNETRLKELETENERNKEILSGKIQQLQNEIDRLLNEKKVAQTNEENSGGSIRRPTVIPTATSKANGKTNVVPPTSSIPCRSQPAAGTPMNQSIVELPTSPVPSANVKRPMIPTRATISNLPQSPVPPNSNLRSSPNQSNLPRNAPAGGIPRLTKNPNSIVKPSATAPTKRPGQVKPTPPASQFDFLRAFHPSRGTTVTGSDPRFSSSLSIL